MLLGDLGSFFKANPEMARTTFGILISNNPHLLDKLERLEVNAKTLQRVYTFMSEYNKKALYQYYTDKRDKKGK